MEDDVRDRRALVALLTRADEEDADGYEVRLRDVPEVRLLTREARLTVDELDGFVRGAAEEIGGHLARSGAVPAGPLRVVHHGTVTEDGDGPVEVTRPPTGTVEPAGELRIRLQRAGREAVTRLSRRQARFPGVLGAYDAVGAWVDAEG